MIVFLVVTVAHIVISSFALIIAAMLAEIKVAPLLIQALFGELFFIMFSVLTR